VPLVEMVTGPDLRAAEEAAQYLTRLRQLLRWLGISEADMEKRPPALRCQRFHPPPRRDHPESQDRDQERQFYRGRAGCD